MGIGQWVVNNKEWLFSGIGVAVGVRAISKLKTIFRKLRARASPDPTESLQLIPAGAIPPLEIMPSFAHRTAKQVLDSVRSAPLLQQPDFARHYRGVTVSWDGTLVGARKISQDQMRLQINCSHDALEIVPVFVTVDSARYPGIGLLRDGARISIDGVMEDVTDSWITVENATVRF